MAHLFTIIFYQPLWNALVVLYNIIPGHDVGIAIIVLTVLIKVVLFPFSIQAIKSQRAMQAIQPKIDELRAKFKDNKEEQAKALMELYKAEKVNPTSSCLPLLVQLPLLIALYKVFQAGLGHAQAELLYPFVANPGALNSTLFGFIDLAKPSYVFAGLAGVAQFFQTKMIQVKPPPKQIAGAEGTKDESMMATVNKQMLYMMPVMTVVIGAGLPGGLTLYWFVTNILTVGQQYLFLRKKEDKKM